MKNKNYNKLYHELLYEVCTKYPDESRHQTALRYIKECENKRAQEVTEVAIGDKSLNDTNASVHTNTGYGGIWVKND